MLTREQMQEDINFLATRQKRTGGWYSDRKRDWGISSNSLVSFAYGVGSPEMPSDWSDYAACVRVARKMPRHRRTAAVMTALAVQRQAVDNCYPAASRRAGYKKAA